MGILVYNRTFLFVTFVFIAICFGVLIRKNSLAQERCTQGYELFMCVSYEGRVPVSSVVPGEQSPSYLDIFRVRLENKGLTVIKIKPDEFYCITLSSYVLLTDRSLYDRIKWPGKLKDYRLRPKESIEKFLFFPSSRDYIRKIVYRSHPPMQIELF